MPEQKINEDDFGKILGKIVLNRLIDSKNKFDDTVEAIKKKVKNSIKREDYDEDICDELNELLEKCENYLEIHAAASHLREYIFKDSKTCEENYNSQSYRTYKHTRKDINFETVSCTSWDKEHENFKKYIKELKNENKKHFVYIFWSLRRKVGYYYVGKTVDAKGRFTGISHPYAHSCITGGAERFTIIRFNINYLEKIEACIIRIFGLTPEHEKRKENKGKSGIGTNNEQLQFNLKYETKIPPESDLFKSYKDLKTLVEKFCDSREEYHDSSSKLDECLDEMKDIGTQIEKWK